MLTRQPTSLRRPAQAIAPALAFVISLVLFIAGLGLLIYSAARGRIAATNRVETPTVCFAPGGSPTAAIVRELNGAHRFVHVQAYSFTSGPIAQALVAAEKHGVGVEADPR